MAITDQTSISSAYQRLGGSNPIITKSGESELSPATQERLRLAEQRQLEEEKALAEQRRKFNLLQTNLPQWAAEEQAGIVGRMGGNEAYKKYMNEQGGDVNKPWIPPQFRK